MTYEVIDLLQMQTTESTLVFLNTQVPPSKPPRKKKKRKGKK